jgi:pyrimidine-specific ribonucleoside hydrolase
MHSTRTPKSKILTGVWLLLLILSLALIVALAPINLQNIPTDWQLTAAARALPDAIPYATLVNLMLVLRYLALAIFFGASGLIVLHQPPNWAGWLAAFTFLFLPLAFNLGGYTEAWPYPPPWSLVLGIWYGLAQLLGMGGISLLIYVYPDGVFRPRWSAWIAGLLLVCMLSFFVASRYLPDSSGLGWMGGMALLFTLLLGGLASQGYRIRQTTGVEQRASRAFVIGLALFLVGTVSSILLSSENQPTAALIFLFTDLFLFCLLPLSVAYSILRDNLWRSETAPGRTAVRYYLAGWSALLVLCLASVLPASRQSTGVDPSLPDALAWDKPPIPLIVDTDLAMDDYLALLFLLRHPGVEIKAITVSGTGEVRCPVGASNLLKVLDRVAAPEIPVACGRQQPLAGNHAFPDAWRDAADSLYGVVLPATTRQPSPGNAVELMQSTLKDAPEPVTVLALGPLTNPGEALQANPELAAEIERMIVMGGALAVPGNVGPSTPEIDNQVAEWNIYADPASANLVLRSGAPVTLVPLDATNFVPASAAFFNRLEANRGSPPAGLAYDLMAARRDVILSGTNSFWDVLTTAVMLDGSLASYKAGGVAVEEAEGSLSGQTRLDANGPLASYAIWADRARFEEHFLQALSR